MLCSDLSCLDEFLRSHSGNKIYLWGAGLVGKYLGQWLDHQGISWQGYYDNYQVISPHKEKPVFKGTEFIPDFSAVYIISTKTYASIKKQLNAGGIPDERIVWFDNLIILQEIQDLSIYGNDSKILDRLKSFHNKHLNQACFVVGNGPSLQIADMEKIGKHGIIALTSNFFQQCYDKTDYRSEYHFWTDRRLNSSLVDERNYLIDLLSNCHNLFTTGCNDFAKYINDPEMHNLIFFRLRSQVSQFEPKFSSNCLDVVYGSGSVTYKMLQLATYMGFKTIYLIGMDCTSSCEILSDGTIVRHPEVQDHASMFGQYKMVPHPSGLYLLDYTYRAAKHYCDSQGIKIYNATRGGKLEVFPRVNLDDILG